MHIEQKDTTPLSWYTVMLIEDKSMNTGKATLETAH